MYSITTPSKPWKVCLNDANFVPDKMRSTNAWRREEPHHRIALLRENGDHWRAQNHLYKADWAGRWVKRGHGKDAVMRREQRKQQRRLNRWLCYFEEWE